MMTQTLSSPAALFSCLIAIGLSAGSPALAKSPHAGQQDTSATTADELAKKVVQKTGNPREVDKLAFSFVVEVRGEEKMRRRHVWWPKKGELKVTRGDETIQLQGLHKHDLTALAKSPEEHAETWKKIAPAAKPSKAAKAWSWFINDSYWLLAPAKLLDPGVNRTLDDQGRLVLTFGEVGLTPGDRYVLNIDPDRGVVTRWKFDLQSDKSGEFRWTNYEKFGPLYLSTRRVSTGESPATVIWFDDIEVE